MSSKAAVAGIMCLIMLLCVLLLTHTVMKDQGIAERTDKDAAKKTEIVRKSATGTEMPSSRLLTKIRESRQILRQDQENIPEEAEVSAPFVSQRPELPNGCEVTSLTMLLRSAGIPADKMTLAAQMEKVPFSSGKFNGNPNEGFVGNMYNGDKAHPGLAVYHGPVADLAGKYLGNRVVDFTGSSWNKVEEQLAEGHPVWVITSINFVPVADSQWVNWHTRQGDMKVSFQEHSVLLTGYDKNHVRFNDPLSRSGGTRIAVKSAFVTAWEQFGRQAITYHSVEK
ncbi:C39 family peptidase [Sporolactobacillus vineae]|uniref:C39 family peptidase n=1 Tax=Sporolactobacillus vineae TaxID=444463 RepID=UPI00028A03EA|nr:C39 family peptidase [Sporolactobacillus vineae]